MFRSVILAAIFAVSVPTIASAFERISDRTTFVNTVGGQELKIAVYGLTLQVRPDDTITGRAMGSDITGSWVWDGGYFCRDMDWSGTPIEYNCQLVELDGDRIRFTVDQGAGQNATLQIR